MDSLSKLIPLIVGIMFIVVGIKTIIKRETTLIIRLWSWGDNDDARSPGGGFSESAQTGMVALLIGVIEVLTGVAVLIKLSGAH